MEKKSFGHMKNKPIEERRTYAQEYMARFGIRILNPEKFETWDSYLDFQCKKGHRFNDRFRNVYSRIAKCPVCAEQKIKSRFTEILEESKDINMLYKKIMEDVYNRIDKFCEEMGRNDDYRSQYYKGAEIAAKLMINKGKALKPRIIAAIGVYIFDPFVSQEKVGKYFGISEVSLRKNIKRLTCQSAAEFKKNMIELRLR